MNDEFNIVSDNSHSLTEEEINKDIDSKVEAARLGALNTRRELIINLLKHQNIDPSSINIDDIINENKVQRKISNKDDDTSDERFQVIYGSILGFIVGDALGVPFEFYRREVLKRNPITDMVGFTVHNKPVGTWSDDTSLTIATIDSINECNDIDYDDIMKKFNDWCFNSKYTATGDVFDVGYTTYDGLQNYKKGINPTQCGGTDINDNGNGSLMRMLPVALYSYYNDLDDNVSLVNDISSFTHAHEISKLGCKIYVDYIKNLIIKKDKMLAYKELCGNDYSKYYSEDSINYYKRILDGKLYEKTENEIESSGFVVSTLEASIWSNLTSNSYSETVLKSVNLGKDTDTVTAISGSIAGIIYGYDKIPKKWLDSLQNKELIYEIVRKFYNNLIKNKTK